MRGFDKLEPADVEVSLSGCASDSRQRGGEDRLDQAELVGFDGSAQRDLVAGVSDGDLDPRHVLCGGDQAPIFLTTGRFRLFAHRSAPRLSARELHAEQVLDPNDPDFFLLEQRSRRCQERP